MTGQPTPEIGPRPMPFAVDFARAQVDGQTVTILTIRTLYGHLVLFVDDAMSVSLEDNLRTVRGGLHVPVNGFQHPPEPNVTIDAFVLERRGKRGPIPVRLPWAPLVPFIDQHVGQEAVCPGRAGQNGAAFWTSARRRGIADFARIHGFHAAELHRWKRTGLTVVAAERLADALGRHPFDIWGRAYHDAVELRGFAKMLANYATCPTCGRVEVGVRRLVTGGARLHHHHAHRKGSGVPCAGSGAAVEAAA